ASCSALKRAYRNILIGERRDVTLVYLDGTHELIARRMASRHGHFMPTALLDSQFATLEPPGADEAPIVVGIDGAPEAIVDAIAAKLRERTT
ncbi:MAG: 6-phosphogluconolactonase, partial [Proteobacteria bacterium]|nr:6-phosphogluconolactonase [Pseudomonadota bacterium]